MKEGFLKSENPNEYVRGNWTIRLDDVGIEIFNNPDVSTGRYYRGPINKIDLETILTEIKEFDFNNLN